MSITVWLLKLEIGNAICVAYLLFHLTSFIMMLKTFKTHNASAINMACDFTDSLSSTAICPKLLSNIQQFHTCHKGVLLAHLNINCLFTKLDEIRQLRSLCCPGVLALCETKLDPSISDMELGVPGAFFALTEQDMEEGYVCLSPILFNLVNGEICRLICADWKISG